MNKKIPIPILLIMITACTMYASENPDKIIMAEHTTTQKPIPEEQALADKLFEAIYVKDVNTVLNVPIINTQILNITNTAGRTLLEEALFQFEQEKTNYIALVQKNASKQDQRQGEIDTTKLKRIYVFLLEKTNLINDIKESTPKDLSDKLFQAIKNKNLKAVLMVIAAKNFEKVMVLKNEYRIPAKQEAFLQYNKTKKALYNATPENKNQEIKNLINLDLIVKFLNNKEKQVIDMQQDNNSQQLIPEKITSKKLTPKEQAAQLFTAIDEKNVLAVNNSAKDAETFEQIMDITRNGRTPLQEAQDKLAKANAAPSKIIKFTKKNKKKKKRN